MDWIASFFVATAFTYLACFVFTLVDKPPLVGMSKSTQLVMYLISAGVFAFVSINTGIKLLNLFLGIFYSFATVGSFIGFPQRWKAYWTSAPDTGSGAQQVGMAFLNLAIAVCFFYLS